jgi:hypothetical protein
MSINKHAHICFHQRFKRGIKKKAPMITDVIAEEGDEESHEDDTTCTLESEEEHEQEEEEEEEDHELSVSTLSLKQHGPQSVSSSGSEAASEDEDEDEVEEACCPDNQTPSERRNSSVFQVSIPRIKSSSPRKKHPEASKGEKNDFIAFQRRNSDSNVMDEADKSLEERQAAMQKQVLGRLAGKQAAQRRQVFPTVMTSLSDQLSCDFLFYFHWTAVWGMQKKQTEENLREK